MADQTEEVIAFVHAREPKIPRTHIVACINAFTDWVDLQMEKESVDGVSD
jgi:hypothetical protein